MTEATTTLTRAAWQGARDVCRDGMQRICAQAARAMECHSLPAGRSNGRFQPSTPAMDRAQSWTRHPAIIVPDDRFRMPEGYEFLPDIHLSRGSFLLEGRIERKTSILAAQ